MQVDDTHNHAIDFATPVKKIDFDDLKSEKNEPITQELIRKEGLKRGRAGLASSLIGFTINEVERTHRVRSEYNSGLKEKFKMGQIFSCLDATAKIGNLLNEELSFNGDRHGDNRSSSALSFMSTGMFNPIRSTISAIALQNLATPEKLRDDE